MRNKQLYRGHTYKGYITEELNNHYSFDTINESSKSRIFSQLSDQSDITLAIISACRPEGDRSRELRKDIADLGVGYVNTVARWIDEDGNPSDETSYIIYNISLKDAIDLGVKYHQHSIFYKDKSGLRLISTNAEDGIGTVINRINNAGTHFMNIKDAERIFARGLSGDVTYVPRAKSTFSFDAIEESLEVYIVERGNVHSNLRYEPRLERII